MLNSATALCITAALMAGSCFAEDAGAADSAAMLEERTLSSEERLFGLARMWSQIKRCYPMWHRLPDLDWDAEFQRRIPAVLPEQSDWDYYRRLEAFAALVRDSHVSVSPPRRLRRLQCIPPVRLWHVKKGFVVVGFASDLGRDSQLELGDEVIQVEGTPVHRYAEEDVLPFVAAPSVRAGWHNSAARLLRGPRGSEIEIRLLKPDGTEYLCHWARAHVGPDAQWVSYEPLSKDRRVASRMVAAKVGYIKIRDFNSREVVDEFAEELEQLGGITGLVIDLRVNSGGNSGNGDRILRRLAREELPGMMEKRMLYAPALHSWGRGSEGMGIVWEEYQMPPLEPLDEGPRFEGELAVLTSVATASAAEDFVGPLKAAGRAAIIGESTFGSTGNPLFFDLPGGGRFRVCTRYMLLPDGTEFIGPGIQPDIEVETTQQDVATGQDPVLERAIAHLNEAVSAGDRVPKDGDLHPDQ